jgi:putative restriction endonuclease
MKFEDWMRHRGLSPSSVEKYAGAIDGPLSEWANEYKLLEGSLASISSASIFHGVSSQIRALTVFRERNARGHQMYSSALAKFSEYLSEGFDNDLDSDIDDLLDNDNLTTTERRNLVKSRIGQGIFRQRLLAYWKKCAVTGFEDTCLLLASHIKPWRVSSNSERLDKFNGLLLTPNLDRAFDSGMVTFDQHGSICISPLFIGFEKLGISISMRVNLSSEHEQFMIFHRSKVFRSQ